MKSSSQDIFREVDLLDVISFDHHATLSVSQRIKKSLDYQSVDFQIIRSYLGDLKEFFRTRNEVFYKLLSLHTKLDFELEEIKGINIKMMELLAESDSHLIENKSFQRYLRKVVSALKKYIQLEKNLFFDYLRTEVDQNILKNYVQVYLNKRTMTIYDVTSFLLNSKKKRVWTELPQSMDLLH